MVRAGVKSQCKEREGTAFSRTVTDAIDKVLAAGGAFDNSHIDFSAH